MSAPCKCMGIQDRNGGRGEHTCRVATGKAGEGMDISHNRNSSRTEASVSRSSITFSIRGSQLVARWQFCTTHEPSENTRNTHRNQNIPEISQN